MTTHPRRHIQATNPRTKDDLSGVCYITSVTCTPTGALVMADTRNRMVKVIPASLPRKSSIDRDDSLCNYLSLGEPHPPLYSDYATRCLVLLEQPCDLATLPDGDVAVTTDSNILYFISAGVHIFVTARVETRRTYSGVAAHSSSSNTLLASSCQDPERRLDACVDVIDRAGRVVRTVVDGAANDWLRSPTCLCLFDDATLHIADYHRHTVLAVDVASGALQETLTHAEMRTPRQICTDKAGNLFVASEYGQCLLVRSPAGQWRKLLNPQDHSRHGFNCPSGVCLTGAGGLVVAWTKTTGGFESELVGYQL